MSNYRRVVATFLSLFLLQLSLPAGLRACTMHRGTAAGIQGAGHDMGDMDMGDAGCTLPSAPGQCETMTACAVIALPSVASHVATFRVVTGARIPEPATVDSRLAAPPELPPPRA